MRVLVTGSFGFLGGRVAQHLAAEGDEVVLGSRLAKPSTEWLPGAPVVAMDWDSTPQLELACAGCQAVVHLAGMNAADSAADPAAALDFNALASGRLMDAAIRQGVRRFIYFSTAHVYASPLAGRITEQTPATNSHPYATTHLAGEEAVFGAAAGREADAIVVRLSNAFGAPAHKDADCWSLLVNDLCRQAATTSRLELRTSGSQRRDFIALTDVCRAVKHLLQLPAASSGARTFNVGGDWAPTVWDVAQLVQERCETVLRRKPSLHRIEPRNDERPQSLDYRIDALRDTGFQGAGENLGEIDRLLSFCAVSFG